MPGSRIPRKMSQEGSHVHRLSGRAQEQSEPFDPRKDILHHIAITIDWQVASRKIPDYLPLNLKIITSAHALFDEIIKLMPPQIAALGQTIEAIDIYDYTTDPATPIGRIKRDPWLGEGGYDQLAKTVKQVDAASETMDLIIFVHWDTANGRLDTMT